MGRRSSEANAAKTSFRWLGIRLPEPGRETDDGHLVAEARSGTTPVDDESKGIWFRCLRSLGTRPRKFYMTRHTFIAWALSEGANLKGLAEYCGTSVQMIEQSYGRYIRKDFLGPLIGARPKTLGKAAVGEKNGPATGPPLGVLGKRPEFPSEFWWRRGELKTRIREHPV